MGTILLILKGFRTLFIIFQRLKNLPNMNFSLPKYKKITYAQRIRLLKLILEQKYKIKQAAEAVHIQPSTARMILLKYKNTREIFESKEDKKTRQLIQRIQKQNKEKMPANHNNYEDNQILNDNRFPIIFTPVVFLSFLPQQLGTSQIL